MTALLGIRQIPAVSSNKMTVGSASCPPQPHAQITQPKLIPAVGLVWGFTCSRGLMVKLPAVGFMHDTYCTLVTSFSDSLVLSYLSAKEKQRHSDHSEKQPLPLPLPGNMAIGCHLSSGGSNPACHQGRARLACMAVHSLAHAAPALGGNPAASTTCS